MLGMVRAESRKLNRLKHNQIIVLCAIIDTKHSFHLSTEIAISSIILGQNKIKNCFNEILEGTMLGSLMKVRIDVFGKAIFFLTCITKAR